MHRGIQTIYFYAFEITFGWEQAWMIKWNDRNNKVFFSTITHIFTWYQFHKTFLPLFTSQQPLTMSFRIMRFHAKLLFSFISPTNQSGQQTEWEREMKLPSLFFTPQLKSNLSPKLSYHKKTIGRLGCFSVLLSGIEYKIWVDMIRGFV